MTHDVQLTSAHVQSVLKELSEGSQETLNILLMEHGRYHRANSLVIPDNGVCRVVPPDSSGRNPSTCWWQDVPVWLAWLIATAFDKVTDESMHRMHADKINRHLAHL